MRRANKHDMESNSRGTLLTKSLIVVTGLELLQRTTATQLSPSIDQSKVKPSSLLLLLLDIRSCFTHLMNFYLKCLLSYT